MSGTGKMSSGAIEYLKGKLQWMIGKMTGSYKTRARGVGHQIKGGAKYETGKAERNLKRSSKH
jgi:uncharacterized protein YjbJ (UPF0337 family)